MTFEPLDIISLGAGVQSSTMGLMAGCGELLPMPAGAIFADTKGEPASVYKWLTWLEKKLPFPVYRVTAGSLAAASLEMHVTKDGRRYSRTNIPFFTRNHDGSQGKIKFRGCTRDFKLKPLLKKERELIQTSMPAWRAAHKDALIALREAKKAKRPRPLDAWRECQSDPLLIAWVGISLDEASRMKTSRDPWILNRHPLIEAGMSRADCLRWMESHGYPKPPRSACVYCPFHNDLEWHRLKTEEPKEFGKAARFEKAIQKAKAESENFRTTPYLHRSLVQLTRVDLRTQAEMGQMNFFENECEGMCGL